MTAQGYEHISFVVGVLGVVLLLLCFIADFKYSIVVGISLGVICWLVATAIYSVGTSDD